MNRSVGGGGLRRGDGVYRSKEPDDEMREKDRGEAFLVISRLDI